MSNDTKEITTPSGTVVVIRNYTTHGDDKAASAILNEGMVITAGQNGDPQVQISASATAASEEKYIELLVQSIDGGTDDIPNKLLKMRSEDYAAVQEAARDIIRDPKAGSKS